jgi:hypothetical protein
MLEDNNKNENIEDQPKAEIQDAGQTPKEEKPQKNKILLWFENLGNKIKDLSLKVYAKLGLRNLIIVGCVILVVILTAIIVPVVVVNNSSKTNTNEIVYKNPTDSLAFTLSTDGSTYEVSGIGDCNDTEISIGDKYNDKNITSIGKDSFACNGDITSITMGKNITNIGDYAFCSCKKLKEIIYKGTKAEWNAITKGKNWDYGLTGLVIRCSDGDINNTSTAKASEGLTFELNSDSTGYILSGRGTCEDNFILIPSEYQGKPVVGVKTFAFCNQETYKGDDKLTGISFPDSITSIGTYSFACCTKLERVSLPQSLNTIEAGAFCETTSLKNITFPSSLKVIDKIAFNGTGLEKVVIPEGVTTLGYEAFGYSKNIKSVTLPTTITDFGDAVETYNGEEEEIDAETFFGCSSLEEIVLPEGITKLGKGMFGNCEKLTEVSLPSTLTVIPKYLFTNGKNIKSVTLHNTLTKIEMYAFNNVYVDDYYFDGTREQWKTILTNSTTDTHLTNIFDLNACFVVHCTDGNYIDAETAYNNMQKFLTNVSGTEGEYNGVQDYSEWERIVIPTIYYTSYSYDPEYTITSIGAEIFIGHDEITIVSIPNTIKKIGNNSFVGLKNLSRILYNGTKEEWNNVQKGANWNYGTGDYTVYCIDGEVDKVAADVVYSEGLSFDATDDGNGFNVMMGSCTDKAIFIPATYENKPVKEIKSSGFSSEGIVCVIMPNTLTTIGERAFDTCSGLKYVEMPEGVTYIGMGAFNSCSALKSIELPSTLTSVGSSVFYNCNGLQEVKINSTQLVLSSETFKNCIIEKIEFAGTREQWITLMENSASNWIDSSATSFVVECTNGRCFDNVNTTEDVCYTDNEDGTCTVSSLTTCPNLIVIQSEANGKTVTKIADEVFKDQRVTSITIPSTITSIGKNAFKGFVPVNFYFNGTVAQWNAIEKGEGWASGTDFTVYCIDGEVEVD